MSDQIVPSNDPQMEERSPSPIVRNVAPVLAHAEVVPEVSFAELWRILRKRKWVIVAVTFSFLAAAVAYCLLCTPKYQAASILQYNKENADSLTIEATHPTLSDATAMDYYVTQQTQVDTIKSDTLALQVVRELKLDGRPEFCPQHFWDRFFPHPDESKLPLERATHRRAAVLRAFHNNLQVKAVDGTRMIKVSFLSPDAELSAAVVNSLVNNYQEQQFRTRFAATAQASDLLAKQLDDLKDQVTASEQEVVQYQKQAGILGTDEAHNIVMTRLEEVDKQVADAEADRIIAQAVWQLAKSGNPELISSLVGMSSARKSPGIPTTMSTIENLRAQQSQLKLDYAQAAARYGSSYPKLVQMQREMNQLDEDIQTEIQNLTTRARNNYSTAQETENALRASFERAKANANTLNDRNVKYSLMKHEAESKRDLYDSLFKQLKEAGVLAALRPTNIVVVDPARPSDRPAKPFVALSLAIALFGGLLVGVTGAFVVENCDDTITTPDEAEQITLVPSLGFVPRWRGLHRAPVPKLSISPAFSVPSKAGAVVLSKPQSQMAEAYRIVRTSILQVTRRGVSNVLLVTSPLPEEGKTTVALNCAAALAQQDQRVLLVEADMRRSNLESMLTLKGCTGLSSLIKGGTPSEAPLRFSSVPNLSVIPAGPRPSNPAELLGSQRMAELIQEWRSHYDFIILDAPPVLSVTDAAVVSIYCDAVVLVVRSGVTRKQSLIRVRDLFMRSRKRIAGVVVNAFDLKSVDHYLYLGYKSSSMAKRGYYRPDVN